MKSVIQALYFYSLQTVPYEPTAKTTENERVAYKKLCETLSEKQKKLFMDYEETYCTLLGEGQESMYSQGLKTGFFLALEIFGFPVKN